MLNSTPINNGINTIINFADKLLFPQFCDNCNQKLIETEFLICIDCRNKLDIIISMDRTQSLKSSNKLNFAYPGYWFNVSLQNCFHLLKYQRFTDVVEYLIHPLKNQIIHIIEKYSIDVLLPVPLHTVKLRERGFNQAEVIANVISAVTKIPVIQPLFRKNWTTTQTMLTINQRKKNIKDAFSLNEIPTKSRILIINDVLTTRLTTNECARILKESKNSIIGIFIIGAARWFKFSEEYC